MKILMLLQRFNAVEYKYDPESVDEKHDYMIPLGLPFISAVLKKDGHDVHYLNLNHEHGKVRDLIRYEVTREKYDFIFIGGVSIYFPNIRDCIRYCKEFAPETTVVCGGGIISSQPEITFDLLKPDFGIIGEGEVTVCELVKTISYEVSPGLVKGIIFKDREGKVVVTPPREPIEDIDDLPFPDYGGFGLDYYLDHLRPQYYVAYDVVDNPRMYPILASRSCPFGCTFCYHPLGKKYRQRSVDSLMREIEFAVKKYQINIIFFYDELFSFKRERVIEFVRRLKEFQKTVPWTLYWNCTLRVDVDEDLIPLLNESHCHLVSLGLESYHPDILKSMKKFTTPEQIDRTLKALAKNNVGVQGSFIFGDSAETLETAKVTAKYYAENQNHIRGGVALGFIVPFQGAPIYQHLVETGKVKDEVRFIKDRAVQGYLYLEPMNITDTLNDDEFQQLKDIVFGPHLTAWHYAIPVVAGEKEVLIRCPFCGEISHIKNINPPTGFRIQNVGCRKCFARFYMVSRWYLLERFMIRTFGFNRIYRYKKWLGM